MKMNIVIVLGSGNSGREQYTIIWFLEMIFRVFLKIKNLELLMIQTDWMNYIIHYIGTLASMGVQIKFLILKNL